MLDGGRASSRIPRDRPGENRETNFPRELWNSTTRTPTTARTKLPERNLIFNRANDEERKHSTTSRSVFFFLLFRKFLRDDNSLLCTRYSNFTNILETRHYSRNSSITSARRADKTIGRSNTFIICPVKALETRLPTRAIITLRHNFSSTIVSELRRKIISNIYIRVRSCLRVSLFFSKACWRTVDHLLPNVQTQIRARIVENFSNIPFWEWKIISPQFRVPMTKKAIVSLYGELGDVNRLWRRWLFHQLPQTASEFVILYTVRIWTVAFNYTKTSSDSTTVLKFHVKRWRDESSGRFVSL